MRLIRCLSVAVVLLVATHSALAAPFFVWQRNVTDRPSNGAGSASVTVRDAVSNALVAVYGDVNGSTTLANPTTADNAGFVRLYLPKGRYKITVTSGSQTSTWENERLGYDADELTYNRSAPEVAAGVTPANYSKAYFARGRYGSFADWRAACDRVSAECYLDDDYAISADTELPMRVDFRGHQVTGAFYTYHTEHNGGYVHNWRAKRPFLRGGYFNEYTGIDTGLDDTGFVTVTGGDGSGNNNGFFWNLVDLKYTTALTLDADNYDINQNTFTGGIARYVHLTGGERGAGGIHANRFVGIDFSNNSLAHYGFLQDDERMYVNSLEGVYFESGSNIVGNVNIYGFQGDATSLPKIGRYQEQLGSVGINERMRGEFISMAAPSSANMAKGGTWDVLDASGKPPSFAHAGAASLSVVHDTTTPGGIGERWQGTMEQDQDRFEITFNTNGDPYFCAVVDYKSTRDFQLVVTGAGSRVFHDAAPATIGMPQGWKRLRLSGPANTSGDSFITLYAANGGSIPATAFSLGGVFVSSERACPAPTKPLRVTRYGSAGFDPASLADGAGVTTTLTVAGVAVGDFAQCSFSAALQDVMLTGWVSAADRISCRFQNESARPVDLPNGTLYGQSVSPL